MIAERKRRHGNDKTLRKGTTLLKMIYKGPDLDHETQPNGNPTLTKPQQNNNKTHGTKTTRTTQKARRIHIEFA